MNFIHILIICLLYSTILCRNEHLEKDMKNLAELEVSNDESLETQNRINKLSEKIQNSLSNDEKFLPYYHTTTDIIDKLKDYSNKYDFITMREESREGLEVGFPIINIKRKDIDVVNRIEVFFGEHSRELISVELGLKLIETIIQYEVENLNHGGNGDDDEPKKIECKEQCKDLQSMIEFKMNNYKTMNRDDYNGMLNTNGNGDNNNDVQQEEESISIVNGDNVKIGGSSQQDEISKENNINSIGGSQKSGSDVFIEQETNMQSDKLYNLLEKILSTSELLVFPIINIQGRIIVENGDYCRRTNSNGVDLNRNWKDHFEPSQDTTKDTYSGAEAFSEVETQILKEYSEKFNPTTFVTVHSGTLGMFIPYAYSDQVPEGERVTKMMNVLEKINPQYCNCDQGSAGLNLKYICPGTCLDYMYDVIKVPNTFAFEIWGANGYKKPSGQPDEPMFISEQSKAKMPGTNLVENLRKRMMLKNGKERAVANIQQIKNQVFIENTVFPQATGHNEWCLKTFNPTTQKDYSDTLSNWLWVLLETFDNSNN